MFERFTSPARRAVVLAQEEARAHGLAEIGQPFVLVGLAATDDALAARALASLGVTQERARSAVRAVTPPGDADPPAHLAWTEAAKAALLAAAAEADVANDEAISTGHLLVGLVRAASDDTATVLHELGVDSTRLLSAAHGIGADGDEPR